MRYYTKRFWPKKKMLVFSLSICLLALFVTVLRCFDTVMYDYDLQRAGTRFILHCREELWVGYSLISQATPSYPGAAMIAFLRGEPILMLIFPALLGISGFQVYADDIKGSMLSVVVPRMGRTKYLITNGIGVVLSTAVIAIVFFAVQFLMTLCGSIVLEKIGIIIDHSNPEWISISTSFLRWILLYVSFSMVAYCVSLFWGKHKVVSGLLFLIISFTVEMICVNYYWCGPEDMACVESYLNHPSMSVFWGWIIAGLILSTLLFLLRSLPNRTKPVENIR